LLCDAGLAGY